MSEQEPNTPEILNPITIRCHCCEEEITTDFENTAYHSYRYQNYFNHVRVICDDGGINVFVVGVSDIDGLEFANQFIKPRNNGFCDDEAYIEWFTQEQGITPLEYKNLGYSDERKVEYFRWLIGTSDIIREFEGN